MRLAFVFSWTNALNFHPRNALSVHFHDREARIAILKAFSALWNEAQLVEDKASHGRVSRVLRQDDVVLSVEIAHVQGGVKNKRAIREREGPLNNVKFVVNLSDHLFEDVFHGHQPEDAAKFVHDHGHANVAGAQLEKQFVGGLGLRHDEHFTQNAAQIEGRRREVFFEAAFAIKKDPYHVLDMNKAEDLVRRAAIDRDPRTLGCCENSHHLVQIGFHGKGVYVRPRHHYLPHLNLSKFHGAENKLFFTGSDQSALAGLLDLKLELFGRMRNTVHLRRSHAQGLHDRTRYSVEQMNGPVKSVQEPLKRHGNQQCHALGTGQAERFGNQFPDYNVQGAQEGKRAGERDGMSEENGVRSQTAGPNRLNHFRERGFAKRAERQAGKRDAKLHARNDAV